jgi:hypothetical protein
MQRYLLPGTEVALVAPSNPQVASPGNTKFRWRDAYHATPWATELRRLYHMPADTYLLVADYLTNVYKPALTARQVNERLARLLGAPVDDAQDDNLLYAARLAAFTSGGGDVEDAAIQQMLVWLRSSSEDPSVNINNNNDGKPDYEALFLGEDHPEFAAADEASRDLSLLATRRVRSTSAARMATLAAGVPAAQRHFATSRFVLRPTVAGAPPPKWESRTSRIVPPGPSRLDNASDPFAMADEARRAVLRPPVPNLDVEGLTRDVEIPPSASAREAAAEAIPLRERLMARLQRANERRDELASGKDREGQNYLLRRAATVSVQAATQGEGHGRALMAQPYAWPDSAQLWLRQRRQAQLRSMCVRWMNRHARELATRLRPVKNRDLAEEAVDAFLAEAAAPALSASNLFLVDTLQLGSLPLSSGERRELVFQVADLLGAARRSQLAEDRLELFVQVLRAVEVGPGEVAHGLLSWLTSRPHPLTGGTEEATVKEAARRLCHSDRVSAVFKAVYVDRRISPQLQEEVDNEGDWEQRLERAVDAYLDYQLLQVKDHLQYESPTRQFLQRATLAHAVVIARPSAARVPPTVAFINRLDLQTYDAFLGACVFPDRSAFTSYTQEKLVDDVTRLVTSLEGDPFRGLFTPGELVNAARAVLRWATYAFFSLLGDAAPNHLLPLSSPPEAELPEEGSRERESLRERAELFVRNYARIDLEGWRRKAERDGLEASMAERVQENTAYEMRRAMYLLSTLPGVARKRVPLSLRFRVDGQGETHLDAVTSPVLSVSVPALPPGTLTLQFSWFSEQDPDNPLVAPVDRDVSGLRGLSSRAAWSNSLDLLSQTTVRAACTDDDVYCRVRALGAGGVLLAEGRSVSLAVRFYGRCVRCHQEVNASGGLPHSSGDDCTWVAPARRERTLEDTGERVFTLAYAFEVLLDKLEGVDPKALANHATEPEIIEWLEARSRGATGNLRGVKSPRVATRDDFSDWFLDELPYLRALQFLEVLFNAISPVDARQRAREERAIATVRSLRKQLERLIDEFSSTGKPLSMRERTAFVKNRVANDPTPNRPGLSSFARPEDRAKLLETYTLGEWGLRVPARDLTVVPHDLRSPDEIYRISQKREGGLADALYEWSGSHSFLTAVPDALVVKVNRARLAAAGAGRFVSLKKLALRRQAVGTAVELRPGSLRIQPAGAQLQQTTPELIRLRREIQQCVDNLSSDVSPDVETLRELDDHVTRYNRLLFLSP